MKERFTTLRKDQRGLTLVELLAVVVILAIVAAIAFILIGNVIENSRKDAHVSNAQQLIAAAKLYDSTVTTISGNVTYDKLQEAKLIGNISDPWKKTPYSGATVIKEADNKYRVQLNSVESGKCNINHTEEELNQNGRGVCD